MQMTSIKFRGDRCFAKEWAGFDVTKPVTMIIGRNNTGKSQLLELIRIACEDKLPTRQWEFKCEGILDESSLRSAFSENTSGGRLGGNHWTSHGRNFVDVPIQWELKKGGAVSSLAIADGYEHPDPPQWIELTEARTQVFLPLAQSALPPFARRQFQHLLADRDIRTEPASAKLALAADGTGATNIIRRFIVSSSPNLPRELIQTTLRDALNQIFGPDGSFTEIQVQQHDEGDTETKEHWEVYLGESKKGLIALSKSGSGLKTVILVLLNLLVVPKIVSKGVADFVFAFEELENNLHPALLRRLLQYLEKYAVDQSTPIFLTTHSSAALDLFGVSENAQIVHVRHDGETATATTVVAHFDRLGIISELGARPSDLLQANGIIWVEGPSDCIYINAWIRLLSDDSLHEGRDYTCAFYGGALLARTQFSPQETAEAELVNLFHINPNVVVVCDSDKDAKGKHLKPRVHRIREEIERIPGALAWVTEAKEIENYLPGQVLSAAMKAPASFPDPGQYQQFFPREGDKGSSYVESVLGRKTIDKMELAALASPLMAAIAMQTRFDWDDQMKKIVAIVRAWNS